MCSSTSWDILKILPILTWDYTVSECQWLLAYNFSLTFAHTESILFAQLYREAETAPRITTVPQSDRILTSSALVSRNNPLECSLLLHLSPTILTNLCRDVKPVFLLQKLYRFINCVELVSPHHAARELVHTIRQGHFTSLFQKSVKRVSNIQLNITLRRKIHRRS